MGIPSCNATEPLLPRDRDQLSEATRFVFATQMNAKKRFQKLMSVIEGMLSFLIVNKNPLKNADQDQDTIGNQTDWH